MNINPPCSCPCPQKRSCRSSLTTGPFRFLAFFEPFNASWNSCLATLLQMLSLPTLASSILGCIMNSTSYDPVHDCLRHPHPCFLPRYTPVHSSGGTTVSGERASLPEIPVVVSVVVSIMPDRRDFAPKTVLDLLHHQCPAHVLIKRSERTTYRCIRMQGRTC